MKILLKCEKIPFLSTLVDKTLKKERSLAFESCICGVIPFIHYCRTAREYIQRIKRMKTLDIVKEEMNGIFTIVMEVHCNILSGENVNDITA